MTDKGDLPNPFVVVTPPWPSTIKAKTAHTYDPTSNKEYGADFEEPQRIVTAARETKQLDSNKLVTNFDNAMAVLQHMLTNAQDKLLGGLRLDTLEVNLEVTAEGKLAFIGGLSGKTSFTLTFKRPGKDEAVSS